MDSPNLMFLSEGNSDFPLLQIDIRAWYFLAIIVGDLKLPSKVEMKKLNQAIVRKSMQIPLIRYDIDENFHNLVENVKSSCEDVDDKKWLLDKSDERNRVMIIEAIRFKMGLLADEMGDVAYPCQLGSSRELNENGELFVQMLCKSFSERLKLTDCSWQTFRDISPTGFKSLHTGIHAAPLKTNWMEIDDRDHDLLKYRHDKNELSVCAFG